MKHEIELKKKTYEELQQTVVELITEKCLLEHEIKHIQERKDYYKHEYFAVCDLLEKMEKALDKACDRLDEISFSKSFEDVKELTSIYGVPLNYDDWKKWCLE